MVLSQRPSDFNIGGVSGSGKACEREGCDVWPEPRATVSVLRPNASSRRALNVGYSESQSCWFRKWPTESGSGWPGTIQFEAFMEERIRREEENKHAQRDQMKEVVDNAEARLGFEIGDGEGAGKMVEHSEWPGTVRTVRTGPCCGLGAGYLAGVPWILGDFVSLLTPLPALNRFQLSGSVF